MSDIPQSFTDYKEVLDIYDSGLVLPEDITITWPDDNYGYIRRFNNTEESRRPGGSGVYYHASYWGRLHDYLWLDSTHPALIREEMAKAYETGAREICVLNVGDIKPLEYNISLFMDMAFDMAPYLLGMKRDKKDVILNSILQRSPWDRISFRSSRLEIPRLRFPLCFKHFDNWLHISRLSETREYRPVNQIKKVMDLLLIIFGVLIIAVGIGMLVKPDLIFDFLKRESNNTTLHIFAIALRLIIGFLLIYFAEMSRYPVAMKVIGWFAIIAAIALVFIGRENFRKLINWAVTFLKPYRFFGALLAIGFGTFLIYAFW